MQCHNPAPSSPICVRSTWLLSLLLVTAIAVVFRPVLDDGFVTWDDLLHLHTNPLFHPVTWAHVGAFWHKPYAGLYIPLTYTTWAALVWLTQTLTPGPLTAGFFHCLNVLLHIGNVLVVYRIGLLVVNRKETSTNGWKAGAAATGALLFGLHPLQVEAVAWVSGLKDVLCGWWALVAVWQYLVAVQTTQRQRRRVHYGLATAAFVLALLAKPAAVVVPIIAGLLATAGFGQRWQQALPTLGGWFMVAVGWSLWTKGQQPDAVMAFITPLWARPVIATDTLVFYLGKLVWPVHLGPDYGRTPQLVLGQHWDLGLGLMLVGVGLSVWKGWWRQRAFGLATGVFVAGLLPVLGVVPFTFQAYSTVADRYVYLALLGPALGLGCLIQRAGQRRDIWLSSVLMLGLLGWRSTGQVQVWRDTVALFTHALRLNPRSVLAHNNLGLTLAQQGNLDEAISHFRTAFALKPEMPEVRYNLAKALSLQGNLDETITHYAAALQLRPHWAEAHYSLGMALAAQDKYTEAIAHYAQALLLKPDWPEAHSNLGNVLAHQGRVTEAIAAYRAALRWRPAWPQVATNLAWLLATQVPSSPQDVTEAVTLAEQACAASSYGDAMALHTLATAYQAAGQVAAAVRTARRAHVVATAVGDAALVTRIEARFPLSASKDLPVALP